MLVLDSLHDARLATLLKQGSVGIIPTDTIYGIVASASHKTAVARLYQLKEREHKPGTIIAADIDQLIALGVDPHGLRAAAHLWPNPLSMIIDALPGLEYLHQDVGSLAVRIPADDDVRSLLERVGPLVTSSANHPGQQPATTIEEAQAYFGDSIDFCVRGGDLSQRPPSTVARSRNGRIEVLRPGAVRFNEQGEII